MIRFSSIVMLGFGGLTLSMLTGCNRPVMKSMGANPMPTFHSPRQLEANQKNISLGVDGFVTPYAPGRNVETIVAGGGALSLTYRLNGSLSPIFIQGAVGGQGGTLKFSCSDDSPCVDGYELWLDSKAGGERYSFWNTQEKILAGSDFLITSNLQLGAGAGIQLYQGGGDYEDVRSDLDKLDLVNAVDGSADFYPLLAYWAAYGMDSGKNGFLKLEVEHLLASKWKESSYAIDVGYFHPSGFSGGVTLSTPQGVLAHVGKEFFF